MGRRSVKGYYQCNGFQQFCWYNPFTGLELYSFRKRLNFCMFHCLILLGHMVTPKMVKCLTKILISGQTVQCPISGSFMFGHTRFSWSLHNSLGCFSPTDFHTLGDFRAGPRGASRAQHRGLFIMVASRQFMKVQQTLYFSDLLTALPLAEIVFFPLMLRGCMDLIHR